MEHKLSFGRIHIIEWLWRPNPATGLADRRTGKEIFQSVQEMIAQARPPVDAMLHCVGSSRALLARLKRIHQDFIATRRVPIVQIETHGTPEGIGLGDDRLTWSELLTALTPINESTGLRLIVFLSACQGFWGIEMAQPLQRAPFFALLGPNRDVMPGEVIRGFRAFYESILVGNDGLGAMAKMNSLVSQDEDVFRIFNCEQLFRSVWDWYLQNTSTEAQVSERIEEAVERRKAERAMSDAETRSLRAHMREYLLDYEARFEESRRLFFMTDLHPENHQRFSLVLRSEADQV